MSVHCMFSLKAGMYTTEFIEDTPGTWAEITAQRLSVIMSYAVDNIETATSYS